MNPKLHHLTLAKVIQFPTGALEREAGSGVTCLKVGVSCGTKALMKMALLLFY